MEIISAILLALSFFFDFYKKIYYNIYRKNNKKGKIQMRVKSFIVIDYHYLERRTNEEIIKLEAKGNEIVNIKITPFPDTNDCSLVTILYK